MATETLGATVNWTPGTNDFNTATNWSTNAVPGTNDLAAFGASSQTTVSIAGSADINGLVLNPGAPAYTFNITAPSANTTLTLEAALDDALTNNSANAPDFNITGAGGQAALNFEHGSSANAVITVNNNGTVNFLNTASSGAGLITVNAGGTVAYAGFGDGASTKIVLAGGTLAVNAAATTLTIGSVEGSGTIAGFSNLVVGGLNSDTTLNASIQTPLASFFKKVGTGSLTLAGSNNYRDTRLEGGTLVLASTGTLGTGALYLSPGTSFISQKTTTLGVLFFNGGSIAAAPGQTVEFNQQTSFGSSAMVFGSPSNTGTIVLSGNPATGVPGTIEIAGGTLRDNTAVDIFNPGALVYAAARMSLFTVDAGATADFNDHSSRSNDPGINLRGSGQVLLGTNASSVLRFQSTDFAGVISGAGQVIFLSSTTAHVLTGANTYTGGTTINAGGTVQLGAGGQLPSGGALNLASLASFHGVFDLNGQNQTIGALSGGGDILLNGGTLTISTASSSTYTGSIQGAGALVFNGPGALVLGGGAYFMTAPIVVNGGTLSIIGPGSLVGGNDLTLNGGTFSVTRNADLGTLSGTGGALAMGNLSQITVTSSSNSSFGGVITGSSPASFIKAGTGTLTLTGNSSFAGPTVISGGALQIGNGGTSGSLAGNITDNAALIFNRSDAVTYNGVISGTGTVTKSGTGALTLAGISTYTGNTTVSAGTLNVTGALASTVSVSSGASLSGTGKVGSTAIASGGTLTPGSSTVPGTLSVAGNLTLAAGSNYLSAVMPSVAGFTTISGSASLNGNFIANLAPGSYLPGGRTMLTATGGISGTFASLTVTGLPASLKASLGYDTNHVYLNLDPNALAPFLSNATANQHNAAAAIDAAVAAGAAPGAGFLSLYGLSGPALNSALDQISGQIGPNVINAVGQGFLSFLSMTAAGGSGETGNFAPGSAYGKADAPHRAQLGTGETRVWGAVYGGHVGLSGDNASGAAGLSSNNVGMIGGADMKVADNILAGVTLGLGRQLFHSGNGSGDSSDFLFGVYGRADIDAAYVAASFGFGWHQIKTLRVITVSGTDVLQGKENARDFGGRIEAGWRVPLDDTYTVTPYGAFAGESFESPAFAETALSGVSTFALSYAARTTMLGRTELGAHLDRRYALDQGLLTANVRAAWAHQLDDLPFTQASFQSLAGSTFQVAGVRPTRDTALLGLDLEVQNASGLFFGLHGEGQFGAGTTIVEGLGNFGWRW